MSIKKAYSGCLELLGHYDKSADADDPAWRGLMPDAPGASSEVLSSGPHPLPEQSDVDTGPQG